jgi:hypothetical protein
MNKGQFMKHVLFFGLLLAIAGCNRGCSKSHNDMTPEEVVEAYLDASLNAQSLADKDNILQYTTGALRRSIAQATDEAFTKSYIDRDIKLEAYAVVQSKKRTLRETEITYELRFKNLLEPNDKNEMVKIKESEAALINSENTVSVVREDRLWMIRDVLGNTTSMEFPLNDAFIIRSENQ